MLLYTFQPLSLILKLQKEKTLSAQKEYVKPVMTPPCDETERELWLEWLSVYSWMSKPYEWIKNQMINRIGIPEYLELEKTYPFWAWYQYDSYMKPKFSGSMIGDWLKQENEPSGLITLEIDKSKVLLSDFDGWNMVLNRDFLDYEYKRREFEKRVFQLTPLKRKDHRHILEVRYIEEHNELLALEHKKTWENCFDLDLVPKILRFKKYQQQIQATFWELCWGDIKEIKIKGGNIKSVITLSEKSKNSISNLEY
jgi:hypothetical protein